MSKISLYEVLKKIGFSSTSDSRLEYDFGNFKLDAVESMNRYLVDIVYFSGINQTERTLGLVEFEVPQEVDSLEQGVAFLSYQLGQNFQAHNVPAWYHQGLLWKHHLPFEKPRVAFNQKPSATIDYEYFRLTIRKLRKLSLLATDEETTTFSFNGEIIRIVCADENIALFATGKPWEGTISIRTKSLSNLPERVRNQNGVISLWEDMLHIAYIAFIPSK